MLYTTASLDSHNHIGVLTIQQQHSGFIFADPTLDLLSLPSQEKSKAMASVSSYVTRKRAWAGFPAKFQRVAIIYGPAKEVISQGKKMRRWAIFQCIMEMLMLLLLQALLSVCERLILLKYWSMVCRAGDFLWLWGLRSEARDHSLFLLNLLILMQKQHITHEESNFGGCWKHRSPGIYWVFVQSTCLGNRLFHAAKAVIFKDHLFQDQVTVSALPLCFSHSS